MPIVHRYIFTALTAPFAITLLFLTSVFVMTRIPDITHMVINYNTGLSVMMWLILFSLPRFLEFTLPMSVMTAVFLTFMKMRGNNEIIALKGGGVSLYRLVPPVAAFCLLATLVTMAVTVWGVPWGKHSFARKGMEMARNAVHVALEPRQFNTPFDGVMIYAGSVGMRDLQLEDVFIEDSRDPGRTHITVAARGRLVSDPAGRVYTLKLTDGMINRVSPSTGAVEEIRFDTYDIHFDLTEELTQPVDRKRDMDELSLTDLMDLIRSGDLDKKGLTAARMELHEKFSVPVACLCLGILAMSLALRSGVSRQAPGLGLALLVFLGYYLLLALGWSAGETGMYPPVPAMWTPDIIAGVLALVLFQRAVRERRMPRWADFKAQRLKSAASKPAGSGKG